MPFTKRKVFTKTAVPAGDLRHRIKIKKRNIEAPVTDSPDFKQAYTTVGEVYAAIESLAPKTPFDGINIEEVPTHRFFIRYLPGISTTHVIVHESNRYTITRVENKDDLNLWLILYCIDKGEKDIEASKW